MRVAERGNHVINRQNIGVKLHTPETKLKKRTKPEAKEEVADMYQEEQPLCTVKIKGVDKAVSRDTLEFYFENERRSGGGEIYDIKSDEEEEDVLYVTFKKAEVAKRVAEKVHSFGDKYLKATLFVPPKPPPCYHDRVIIKGFNPSTTQDCLFNFIAANTGLIPDKMDYHAELEGVAMVTFQMEQEQDLDFKTLERVFSKSKLEGASLKIARVPVSNCILVSNMASYVTKDTVEYYFENVRKSGGGQVQTVVMNDDESCLVFFQDYSVVDSVVRRQHILSNQTLDVMRFQECLCKPEGELAERKLRIPEAIVLADVDPSKIEFFMKASKANKQAIEVQLQICNTAIVWPRQQENVILQCTITSATQNCYKLVKEWRENAQRNFEDFMKLITVHKVPILQEVWQNVMDELKTVTIEKPDAVALFVDKSDGILTIVGNKPVSDSLAKRVNVITKKVLEEAERVRQKGKYIATRSWVKSKERN